MKPLGGAVSRVLKALGLEQKVATAAALPAWREAAVAVLGADASRTEALRIDGTTIVVSVPTAQWAAELRLRERDVLDELGKRAPGHGIRRIRSVPSAHSRS